jgi:hypothetical protein
MNPPVFGPTSNLNINDVNHMIQLISAPLDALNDPMNSKTQGLLERLFKNIFVQGLPLGANIFNSVEFLTLLRIVAKMFWRAFRVNIKEALRARGITPQRKALPLVNWKTVFMIENLTVFYLCRLFKIALHLRSSPRHAHRIPGGPIVNDLCDEDFAYLRAYPRSTATDAGVSSNNALIKPHYYHAMQRFSLLFPRIIINRLRVGWHISRIALIFYINITVRNRRFIESKLTRKDLLKAIHGSVLNQMRAHELMLTVNAMRRVIAAAAESTEGDFL